MSLARSIRVPTRVNICIPLRLYAANSAQLRSREYYERTNELIEQYMYIDCLLDSSIPHELLNEYSAELDASAFKPIDVPATISEEPHSLAASFSAALSSPADQQPILGSYGSMTAPTGNGEASKQAVALPQKRTPKDIFRSSENLPLLQRADTDADADADADDDANSAMASADTGSPGPRPNLPWLEDGDVDSDDPVVTVAIWINMFANITLLVGKLVVIVSVPSMSVLASLVDAVLDFLSTAIVWTTTRLISAGHQDQHHYPVGRRRFVLR